MKKILITAIVFIAGLSSFAQVGFKSHVIAYYPFNGNSIDESQNDNDGTVYGASLTTDRFGNDNSAYSFNGTSDYISCGNKSVLNKDFKGLTISAWILVNTDATSEQHVIGKWANTTSDDHFCLRTINMKLFWFVAQPNLSTGIWGGSKTFLSYSKWQHVVGVWDSTGCHKIYIDGKLTNKFTPNNLTYLNTKSSSNLSIGKQISPSTHSRYFNGKIDDIYIFDKALDSNQIDSLKNEVIPKSELDIRSNNPIIAKIHPNPVNDNLNVIVDNFKGATIYNNVGKLLINSSSKNIPTNSLSPGVYIIQIQTNDNKSAKSKFLKI